jgi:hypothetical protein
MSGGGVVRGIIPMKTLIYDRQGRDDYGQTAEELHALGAVRSQQSCWKVPVNGRSIDLLNYLLFTGALDLTDLVEIFDHETHDYVWKGIFQEARDLMLVYGPVWTPLELRMVDRA